MRKRCVVFTQATLGIFIPFILLTIGMFTPYWIVRHNVYKGLFFEVSRTEDYISKNEVIDTNVTASFAAAFGILFLSTISCLITVCCYGPDKHNVIRNPDTICHLLSGIFFYLTLLMILSAGSLQMGAAIRLATLYPNDYLGVSFFLCIASSSLIFIMILIFLFDWGCKDRGEELVFRTLLQEIYD